MIREDYSTTSSSGISSKSIYYIPPVVRNFMKSDCNDKMKVVCAGVKVLEKKVNKHDNSVDYRLIQVILDKCGLNRIIF